MSLKVWIDGKLVDKENAKISVYDHGLLYGDGVFEGIRVYSGKIFECEAHLRRLFDSAKAIRLNITMTAEQIRSAMEQTVKANGFSDCYIRVVVTRGTGSLGIDPATCPAPTTFIITDTITVHEKSLYEKGIPVVTSSLIRMHPNALSPRIKSLNYLNNILARIEARDAGCPEAIMLNHEGNVAEATVQNVFIVRNNRLQTPLPTDGILEGVTRRVIMELSAKNGIPCEEKVLQRLDLYLADEIFLTGTGAEVMPVTKVDGRIVGQGIVGPITRKLMDMFSRHVREA